MHAYSKRIIAGILLFSHSLMSCFNTPAVTSKEELARIAQKANKQRSVDLIDNQWEALGISDNQIALIAATGQQVVFSCNQGVWKAQIMQKDVEDLDEISNQVPVIFEPGYRLTDIVTQDLRQHKQLVHIIPKEVDIDGIGYVYIGREPITFNHPARQHAYPSISQSANKNTKINKTDVYSLPDMLNKDLLTESVATNKNLSTQLPPSKQPHLHEKEKEAKSTKPTSTTRRQQSTIHATQQVAQAQRMPADQTEEAISLLEKEPIEKEPIEKEPIEQATDLQLSQVLSPLELIGVATKEEQLPVFIAKGGHRVQFTDNTCQQAIVHANVPPSFRRLPLTLRVITEEPSLQLTELLSHRAAWHKNYIQIIFPEHGPDGQGYVYIGSLGVRGGGNNIGVGNYVVCNECGNSARVVRKVKDDQFLWINFNSLYYDCAYCAQRRREREQRERVQAFRKEQEQIRQKAERREQKRRHLEEERRRQEEQARLNRLREEQRRREEALRQEEEERKQREWEEETRRRLVKLEKEREASTRKIENLEKEYQQQQRETVQVGKTLEELQEINSKFANLSKKLTEICQDNQHLEEGLIAKQQYKKELYERIQKTHGSTENLFKNDNQEDVNKFAEKRNQAQYQAKEALETSRKIDRQLEALTDKLRVLRKKLAPSVEDIKARENINFDSPRPQIHRVSRSNKNFAQEYESSLKQYQATLDQYEAILVGRSRGIEKDVKDREEIKRTIQSLRGIIEKGQALLQGHLATSTDLQRNLQERIKQETAQQQVLLGLEKGLEQLQQAMESSSKLEERLIHAQAKNEQGKKLVEVVEETGRENQGLEEKLAAAYRKNEEQIENIRETYGLQEELGAHFAEAQQNLLKVATVREEATQAQEKIKDDIKARAQHIEKLKAGIQELQEAEAKQHAALLTQQRAEKTDNLAEKREEIIHEIETLEKSLEQEQQHLEEQYFQLKSIQDNLKEQLQQEQEREQALVDLERKLKRNKEVGDEIEKIIQEAWEEALASAIASEERLEAYIHRLHAEEKLLRERGMSEQALEELTRQVALAEKKLKEAQIEKIKQEQEAHKKEANDLRDAYENRRAQLEKGLNKLEEQEAAEQAEYEEKMAEWEANNRKKSEEEAQRLEQLRREAEEARRIAEEGKRELEQLEAEIAWQKKKDKGWWGTAWDFARGTVGVVWDGVKWVGNRIVDGCEAVGRGISWLSEKTWEGTKWLGGKIWEGLKKVGKWIWDNKWEILKWIGIIALVAAVIWVVGSLLAVYLSSAGIGSMGGLSGWLLNTAVGKFLLGALSSSSMVGIGTLLRNGENIINFLRGRGWVTNAEHEEEEKQRRQQQATREREEAERKIREEARRQQEAREKEEAERKIQEEARKKEEASRQQEAREREEAERKIQEEARKKEEARRQQEAREREEARKKEEEARKKAEKEALEADRKKEKEKEEEKSDSENESTNNFFQNFVKNFTNKFKKSGPEQQRENAKTARIEDCARQAQDIIEACQQTGPTPELQKQAQELFQEIERLLSQENISRETINQLCPDHGRFPELQENLNQRLNEIADNISRLEEIHDNLTAEPDLFPEEDLDAEGDPQEEAAYQDLTKYFNNPTDVAELADNGQQAVQELLRELPEVGKEVLKEQAETLKDALGSLIRNMQAQHGHIEYVYEIDSDASDYIIQNRAKGKQDLKSLEKSMRNTQAGIEKLCEAFDLDKPNLTPEPPISKEALKKAFNLVLDTTIPGSDLIKVLLGTEPSPKNLEECLKLAASTVLDFVPGGKAMKAFKGAAAKLGIKKVEQQLLKEARKAAKRMGKAKKLKLPSLDATGKVHGSLPIPKDLSKYSKNELQTLLKELKQSVQKRIEINSKMGRDKAHGQRQGTEQALIKAIEKHLCNS